MKGINEHLLEEAEVQIIIDSMKTRNKNTKNEKDVIWLSNDSWWPFKTVIEESCEKEK